MTATLKALHGRKSPQTARNENRRGQDTRPASREQKELGGAAVAPEDRRRVARLRLLRLHFEARVGHIGGNFSALDILLCLYHDVLAANDQFILSKGHAAGALYVTLWTVGRLAE